VAGCCECGDEASVSCATELVITKHVFDAVAKCWQCSLGVDSNYNGSI
jgi:hypothetical protein